MCTMMERLVGQIRDQISTLRDRDGVTVSDEQVSERARSIVTVLLGLYDVRPYTAASSSPETVGYIPNEGIEAGALTEVLGALISAQAL
jgi:hypothetical protein